MVLPISSDPTIDRIHIQRYSGSAILIGANATLAAVRGGIDWIESALEVTDRRVRESVLKRASS